MILPFFNDYEKEVNLSYGDVHNECIISSHSEQDASKSFL